MAALRAAAPLALMVVIFWLSSQSDPGTDIGSAGRILAHGGEYALLAALWIWALTPTLGRRGILVGALIAFAYAISDEIHQSYVPGRDADPFDVLVDAAGITLAVAVLSHRRLWVSR